MSINWHLKSANLQCFKYIVQNNKKGDLRHNSSLDTVFILCLITVFKEDLSSNFWFWGYNENTVLFSL